MKQTKKQKLIQITNNVSQVIGLHATNTEEKKGANSSQGWHITARYFSLLLSVRPFSTITPLKQNRVPMLPQQSAFSITMYYYYDYQTLYFFYKFQIVLHVVFWTWNVCYNVHKVNPCWFSYNNLMTRVEASCWFSCELINFVKVIEFSSSSLFLNKTAINAIFLLFNFFFYFSCSLSCPVK